MTLKVVVPVEEKILQAAERRKAAGVDEDITQFLAELINLGFEHRLQQLYKQFEAGEISLGYLANELGLGWACAICTRPSNSEDYRPPILVQNHPLQMVNCL